MGRDDELRALGRLAGDGLTGLVRVAADMHAAVNRRVSLLLPPGASSISEASGVVAAAVYSGVAAGQRFAPQLAGELLSRIGPPDAPLPSETRWGSLALGAVNGIWGDVVAERYPTLAVPMTVRADGVTITMDDVAPGTRVPGATPRIVLFVHGLVETDRFWWRRDGQPADAAAEAGGDVPLSYGDRLAALGFTPLYLHYNSGLRVSENGRLLAELLDRLVSSWPVPVEEVSIVGHSMGGLVARSACHQAELKGLAWPRVVRTVVTLGTPHLGASLAKAVHMAGWVLSHVPETAPLTRVLAHRSAGVRDLTHGALISADWEGHDPEAFLEDTCGDVPFLPQATYCFVAATLTVDPRHPLGVLLGDGLVRLPSASGVGRTRRIPFEVDRGVHLTGLHHFSLLNHPAVYAQLEAWLIGSS